MSPQRSNAQIPRPDPKSQIPNPKTPNPKSQNPPTDEIMTKCNETQDSSQLQANPKKCGANPKKIQPFPTEPKSQSWDLPNPKPAYHSWDLTSNAKSQAEFEANPKIGRLAWDLSNPNLGLWQNPRLVGWLGICKQIPKTNVGLSANPKLGLKIGI